MAAASASEITKLEHHEQQDLCRTRPPYRQGKKLTAVKVYTINDESQHLIACGVPAVQLTEELKKIFLPYGTIKKLAIIPGYPYEEFTESFHVHYERIQSARIAKRFVDGKNFYGGLLHVFYAPELESVAETKRKLLQRRKDVAVRINRQKEEARNLTTDVFVPREQYHRKKRYPALPLTDNRLAKQYPGESRTSIYHGIPREIDPRPVLEPSLPNNPSSQLPSTSAGELKLPENGKGVKRKNYKGQVIDDSKKVHIVRPKLIDTKKLANFNSIIDKPIVSVVKKVENGIKIKLLPKTLETTSRIVIKSQSTTELLRPSTELQNSIVTAKMSIREAMKKK